VSVEHHRSRVVEARRDAVPNRAVRRESLAQQGFEKIIRTLE
jgi:hypothetical protein